MKLAVRLVSLVIALCGAHIRLAAEELLQTDRPCHPLVCPGCLLRGCCDDYCPKPAPCLPCPRHCCGPDDYCPKCPPCISRFRGCECGCYCPKPFPELCRPLAADYFTCVRGCAKCDHSCASCAEFAQDARSDGVAARSPRGLAR